eukprot:gene2228-33794_t
MRGPRRFIVLGCAPTVQKLHDEGEQQAEMDDLLKHFHRTTMKLMEAGRLFSDHLDDRESCSTEVGHAHREHIKSLHRDKLITRVTVPSHSTILSTSCPLLVALLATSASVDGRKIPRSNPSPPAMDSPSPPSHWAPAPPTPEGPAADVGRNKFIAYMAMETGFNFSDVNATLLEADFVIAASRAFYIPENNGPTDTPPGVAVWEVRAIDAADLVNNTQVDDSFISGIYVEFDTSYPTILTLPGSINSYTTWPGPITVSSILGAVSIATLDHSFSTTNNFFYYKYHILEVAGSPVLPPGNSSAPILSPPGYELYNSKLSYADASAFCSNSGATLVTVEGEMAQLLASMACEPSMGRCWVAGQGETGCSSVISEFALVDCIEELPFVCFRA